LNTHTPLDDEARTSHVCPVCAHGQTRRILPPKALWCKRAVRKCPECGSSHLELSRRDRLDDYWRTPGQTETYARPEVVRARLLEVHRRLQLIGPPPEPGALLVDVGCGTGEFLAGAVARGWRCLGIESSERALAIARESAWGGSRNDEPTTAPPRGGPAGTEQAEYRIVAGSAGAIPAVTGGASCVTFWDVLEHLTEPAAALAEAARVLRPGGIVAVVTPNEDGLLKILAKTAWRLLGRQAAFLLSYVYYVPHYVSFTCRGLNLAFRRAGLSPSAVHLEETDLRFARAKIATHYGTKLYGRAVRFALPAALLAARIAGRGNKIVALGIKRND